MTIWTVSRHWFVYADDGRDAFIAAIWRASVYGRSAAHTKT